MLTHPGILALNRLLDAEPWARDKLKAHAGQCVAFRAPPLPALHLEILDTGLMTRAAEDAVPDLVVNIRPGALPALLRGEDALLREIGIDGNADLAGTAQDLFRNLRWDVEEDLSHVIGDALAHRVVEQGKRVTGWGREASERLAQNFAEYWTEEQPLLARLSDLHQFLADVERLRQDLARIQKRIEALTRNA